MGSAHPTRADNLTILIGSGAVTPKGAATETKPAVAGYGLEAVSPVSTLVGTWQYHVLHRYLLTPGNQDSDRDDARQRAVFD